MMDKEKFKQLPYREQLKVLMEEARKKKDTKMMRMIEEKLKEEKIALPPETIVKEEELISEPTLKSKPKAKEEQSTYELLKEVEELLIRAGMYKPRKLPSR